MNPSFTFSQGGADLPYIPSPAVAPPTPVATIELKVSLEDFFHGVTKKLKVTRKRYQNRKIIWESKVLEVTISPGCKIGTKITFPEEGDQLSSAKPNDLCFELVQKIDERFVRQGNDLIHKRAISLTESLTGCILTLPSISGNTMQVDLTPFVPVPHGYLHLISGEGMKDGKTGPRGNYFVEISVVFPVTKYTKEQIEGLVALNLPRY